MKRRTLVIFAVSCFTTSFLSAQVNAPKVGIARYADSTVRAVYGVESAFVAGRQALASADAISFSDSGGLLSASGRITLVDSTFSVIATFESGEPAALLNMDGGLASAIAWLPSRQSVLHWNGKSFDLIAINGAAFEQVTSISAESQSSAKLLFSENGAAFEAHVSFSDGNIISIAALPGIQGPVFQQNSFLLFHNQEGLEIASASGALRTFALQAPDLKFERMSTNWLHLTSPATGQNWVLHLNSRIAQLAELPNSPSRPTAAPAGQTQEVAK